MATNCLWVILAAVYMLTIYWDGRQNRDGIGDASPD